MNRIIAALMALILIMTAISAAGCEAKEDPYKGYCTDGELAGGAALQNANAKSVTVSSEGDGVRIRLEFYVGSRMSGSSEEAEASTVPAYKVYRLGYPSRLAVEFNDLEYADFARAETEYAGCVQGAFVHRIMEEKKACIYFQLSADPAFKAFASGNVLEIEIKPMAEAEKKKKKKENPKYQVTANAYDDYCEGKLTADGLTPTLDADKCDVLLISGVMDSDIAAEMFIKDIVDKNISAVQEEWTIIEADKHKLPQYDDTLVYKAAYSQNVLRSTDGNVESAEVLIPDGWYLTQIPKRAGGGALYTKRIKEKDASGDYTGERLYIRNDDGTSEEFMDYGFETIESAEFSPDGRKLAILERAAEATNLYIIDVEAEEVLTDLTDVGFGDSVSAYTWDDIGTTIYAVSGTDSMTIHQYDFDVPDESKRHSIVEKNGADEGSIAFADGRIYFVQGDMENGDMIYRVKCDGGVRRQFTYGSLFALSGNKEYMAINAESGAAASSTGSEKLRIYEMDSGSSIPVSNEFGAQEFVWSRDGSRLYYFENRLSGDEENAEEGSSNNDEYPYTLWVYDLVEGKNRRVADMPTTAIFPGDSPEILYLNFNDSDTMGEKIRATYILDADRIAS